MPPNKLVRKGQQQQFYPQCTSCSNLQGETDFLQMFVTQFFIVFKCCIMICLLPNMTISGNINSSCFASGDKINKQHMRL